MEYLFTERAHLMCPNMYFGMAFNVPAAYEEKKIVDCVEVLAKAHPFLRATLGYDRATNAYFYDVQKTSQVQMIFKDSDIQDVEDGAVMAEYETITERDWDITKEGLLKVVAWKAVEATCFLMVFHHLLADGRGALGLAQELAAHYVKGVEPRVVPEKLIASLADLPQASELSFINRQVIRKVNKDWEKEANEPLTYEAYHEYADRFLKEDKVVHTLLISDAVKTEELVWDCREHSVTVNDLLMARMFLQEKTDKIIIASDLRKDLSCYNEGALGNYASAFSVVVKSNSKDEYQLAGQIHEKVQEIMKHPAKRFLALQCYGSLNPALLDATFMASRGAFKSKTAELVGKKFFGLDKSKGFSISNLGRVQDENIVSAYFIPPASPAIRKTCGVLTVNGRMTICVSER